MMRRSTLDCSAIEEEEEEEEEEMLACFKPECIIWHQNRKQNIHYY
jgi:hypothetical protein